MTIWGKIREKSQLGTDGVVQPARPFIFSGVPAIGSIVEISLSANETLYKAVSRSYIIGRRILQDASDTGGECFDPLKWHFHLVLFANHSKPIYERLYIDCRIQFSDAFERRRFGEYGAATLLLNGVPLGSVILPALPVHNNDIVHFKDCYYRFEKTTYKADKQVYLEIGELMGYNEVFDYPPFHEKHEKEV